MGQGHGLAAQIVGGDRRVQRVAALQQPAGEPLVVGVGGALGAEGRQRPATLRRPGRLLVPVGALDQPHAEPAAESAGRGMDALGIGAGLRQVGLQGDRWLPGAGEGGGHVEEQVEDQRLQLVVFHVRRHRRAVARRRRQQRFEAREDAIARAGGIERIEARSQRRELQRQMRRPAARLPFEQIEIAGEIGVGLRLRQHRLADRVERRLRRHPRQLVEHAPDSGRAFFGEKAPRQAPHEDAHAPAQRRARRQPEQPALPAGARHAAQIGGEMRRNVAGTAQLRQDIDQLEQPVAQLRIGHRLCQQPAGHAAVEPRPAARGGGVQAFTDGANLGFEVVHGSPRAVGDIPSLDAGGGGVAEKRARAIQSG